MTPRSDATQPKKQMQEIFSELQVCVRRLLEVRGPADDERGGIGSQIHSGFRLKRWAAVERRPAHK